MEGVSMGEILLILVLALVFLDPKDAGRAFGRFQRWRRQWKDLTDSVKTELSALAEPARAAASEAASALEGDWWNETDPARLRAWSRERLGMVDAAKASEAARQVLERLRAWPAWQEARDVALFAATAGEVPTQPLLEAALAAGKRVWMPWVGEEPGRMDMAPVAGSADLEPGRFGILEPRAALRGAEAFPAGGLVLVPGTVFDHHGHRIGRGKGYYDRWLARHPEAIPAGLCFDVQVHPGRLVPQPHDVPLRHLLTEYRLESFSPASTPSDKAQP